MSDKIIGTVVFRMDDGENMFNIFKNFDTFYDALTFLDHSFKNLKIKDSDIIHHP